MANIPKLNEGSDLGLLGAFTSSMLPASCTAESEATLAKLVDEYAGMKPQVVKAVKGTHQQINRCIKALELLK
ncbi:hypothetical protein ACOYR1_12685 [Thalassotalea piscium]